MKTAKFLSAVFAVLGAVLVIGTAVLSFTSLDAPVRLLSSMENAEEKTEALMDAICQGNYTSAASVMYGRPELDAGQTPSSELGVLLWDAYGDSLSYEFTGGCYATDSGVARDVTITALDISAVMEPLEEHYRKLLQEAEGSDSYDMSDENREAFVMGVLCDAAAEVLEESDYLTSRSVTLNLTCQDGQWWILPEQELLNVISGGVGG